MGSIKAWQFSRLSEDQVEDCVALSAEAGWNQTSADWALFLRQGTVFGLRSGLAGIVATGAVLPYGGDFAWISMVLVTRSRRRQRIGTSILEACCAELARRTLVAVLDATPAGERIYRALGFEGMFNLSRWQGISGPRKKTRAVATRSIAAAFGADRRFLLQSLFDRLPQLAFIAKDNAGFVLARPGRVATQIGPLVAANEDVAAALLDAALGCVSGPVFLDLIDGREILAARLRQRGFTVQRPFLRMGLKRGIPFGDTTRLFVVAGPEFG
jgi:GNAT superfamily N-acetyltransferase